MSLLPTLEALDSVQAITAALSSYDPPTLSASLQQLTKNATFLLLNPNPKNALIDYLNQFPTQDQLFSAWDIAQNSNNSQLSAQVLTTLNVFIRLLSIYSRVDEPELIKRLLSNYGSHLERALNPGRNDVTVSALKLMNTVISFGTGRFSKRLFSSLNWQPKIFSRLFKTRLNDPNQFEKNPDIRTLLVFVILTLFITGDAKLKFDVLDTKALISNMIKGLAQDSLPLIDYTLFTLHNSVLQDKTVSLESRRTILEESNLLEFLKLYDSENEEIRNSIHKFLLMESEWLAGQIGDSTTFKNFGPQKVLLNLLKSLKVAEDSKQRELALSILSAVPILSGSFWSKFPSSLEARLSTRWISSITFLTQTVSLPLSVNFLSATQAPPTISSVIDLILPSPLTKTWFIKSLQSESELVRFLSSLALLGSAQKGYEVLRVIGEVAVSLEEGEGGRWRTLGGRLREWLESVFPDPQIIVALMGKSSTVASIKPVTVKKGKAKKKVKGEEDIVMEGIAKEDVVVADVPIIPPQPQHLQTNVSLRILYTYHRVVPKLILSLKYDFSKLPSATFLSSSSEKEEKGVEGLLAISSTQALRLAFLHHGQMVFSRPGDHFKNTLLPLFQLYRKPSTPLNRTLLLSGLQRLLSLSILFTPPIVLPTAIEGEEFEEVEIWLNALPVPQSKATVQESSEGVLEFFEKVVQKTLVSPIKLINKTEDAVESNYSPLLRNFLVALTNEITKDGQNQSKIGSLLEFVKKLIFGFIGFSISITFLRSLIVELINIVGKVDGKAAKQLKKMLKDSLKVLEGKVDVKKGEGQNPISNNMFVDVGEVDLLALQQIIEDASIELVFLHVRPIDLSVHSSILLNQISTKKAALSVTRILIHRYLSNGYDATESNAFVNFFTEILKNSDELMQQRLKNVLFGAGGRILQTFDEIVDGHMIASITSLIALNLSVSAVEDVILAENFCMILLEDLTTAVQKITPRVLSSASLIQFFNDSTTLPFLSTLLKLVPKSTTSIDDNETKEILEATFTRASTLQLSEGFVDFWIQQFSTLLRINSSLPLAGSILLKGSELLLPYTKTESGILISKSTIDWKVYCSDWTSQILESNGLKDDVGKVLGNILYRSVESRNLFKNWIGAQESSGLEGSEAAIRALIEVESLQSGNWVLPSSIVITFLDRLLKPTEGHDKSDCARVVEFACQLSESTKELVKNHLELSIAGLEREEFNIEMLQLLDRLEMESILEIYVNESFSMLTRRFAEDESDGEIVENFIAELASVCERHPKLVFKAYLLDPVITAAATKRLEQPLPMRLATVLSKGHSWNETELTRLLNGIFAQDEFKPRILIDEMTRKVQGGMTGLIIALSSNEIMTAANSRVVEKLLPFYGGTLSKEDVEILNFFKRVELTTGQPISVAFRKWNPSLDHQTISSDSSRVSNLSLLEVNFVKRSWNRICASSSTTFPQEYANITYDPEFLLPFFSQIIAEEELKGSQWIEILDIGILGMVISALASSHSSIRKLAQATLADSLVKVQTVTFREKDEIVLILTHAKNCIYSQEGESIPAIIALFLANAMLMVSTPESYIYPPMNKFLLQRALLDQRDLPMFYNLFFTTSEDPVQDQRYLLKFLADGLVRSQDWKIFRRRQTFELLASLLQTNRNDPITRKLILQFLIKATSIRLAAKELLSRNGLLSWISTQIPLDGAERRMLITIIGNIVEIVMDRADGVVEVVDTLTAICGTATVSAAEVALLLSILNKLSTTIVNIPESTSASNPIILNRIRSLLQFVSTKLPSKQSNIEFYQSVMLNSFVRKEVGLREEVEDLKLFTKGLEVGLGLNGVAGERVREQVMRSFSM